jgi:hypothetical protein
MIVDDISAIRSLTKEVLEKDVHFFDLKPMTLTTGIFGNGGTSAQGAWVAPNAPAIPPVYYYLKDRIASGGVKLDIIDAEGKLVQSIPGTQRKGINKISWNLRGKGPKTAAGTKPDYGSFVAPQVLPGSYTMKLKVADKEYIQPLVVQHDPASLFTLEDRKLQYGAAMELFDLHERLSKDVDSINTSLKMLKDAVAKEPNVKKKKKIQEKHDKLDVLKAELVPVKQTSMFADETRLRDEITDVYRAVCSGETVPSNLQLERIQQLKARVDDAEKRMMTILAAK